MSIARLNYLSKIQKIVVYLILLFFIFSVIKFLFNFGPFYSTDIVDYSRMANDVANGYFPHSQSFSPGYPFLVGMTSKILKIHESKSIFFWIFMLIISSIYFTIRLLKINSKNENLSFEKIFFISFVVISHWAIFKILLTAHADSLFLTLLLIYFIFLYLWLSTFKIKWLVITTLFASLCIWVKYNGLILLPFLILTSLFFGHKKFKKIILIFPLLTLYVSYFCFKNINGTTIKHFQPENFYSKIEFALNNSELLFSNLVLSGRVYLSVIFTNSIQILVSDWLAFGFNITFILFFLGYFCFTKIGKKIENVFLLFSVFYWFTFFTLCQFAAHEEIDIRTMMPSVISFLLWIVFVFKYLKDYLKRLIVIIVIFNLIYSIYFITILNSSTDKKNTFNYISNFENKKSIIELKKLQKIYNLGDRIYTNEIRNVLYAFDYKGINRYPSRKIFANGKFRELDNDEYNKIQQTFCEDFSNTTSAVLLIDCPKLIGNKKCLLTKYAKVYHIENDILIINVLK